MEVVLKVVALVELVALVQPLSVGRVVPSCGGTKESDISANGSDREEAQLDGDQLTADTRGTRKKRLVYETNANKRNQMDRRYMRSLQKKMREWYTRTRLPTLCLAFRKGQFWIATDVPQLREFNKDPQVQQAFKRHFQTGFNRLPAQPTPEAPSENVTFAELEELTTFKVVDLRKMVIKAVMSDGRRKANWGVEASKPSWWPGGVEFVDINNSRSRPRFQQLHLILEAFRDWRQQGLQPDEEMDEDCTHDPHSPEVPFQHTPSPAQSTSPTPAQFSSTPPAQFRSTPAQSTSPTPAQFSSTPAQSTSSPPAQFTSTPAQSTSSPSSQTRSTPAQFTFTPAQFTSTPAAPTSHRGTTSQQPPVSPISPARLLDMVSKTFGADSVYCGDPYKEVLNSCHQLNFTQTSKVLRILGKLNEDAETHVTIKPAIAREILGCMVMLPWEVNLSLCPHILNHFPYLAPPQYFTSEDQRRLPERFSRYVPSSVHELGLEPFYSSGDGNCFYNSLSILMCGHEHESEIYRLGAALYGLGHYEHIVEANMGRLNDRGDALQWAATVSLSAQEVEDLNDQSIGVIVSKA